VALVLTQNNNISADADQINQDSDLQQATTHFDYLKVNGHQIWISDFAFNLELNSPSFTFNLFKDVNFQLSCASFSKLSNILTSSFQLSV